jgi:hypothetical protein
MNATTEGSPSGGEERAWDFERDNPQQVQAVAAAASTLASRMRELWKLDGRAETLSRLIESAVARVEAVWRAAVGMQNKEGPDPGYDGLADDVADRVVRIIRKQFRQIAPRNGDDGEGEGGEEQKRILNWILGVVATVLAGGIFGGVAMYGKLTAIEKGQTNLEKRQDEHEQRIGGLERDRYRGGPSGGNAPP